MTAVCWKKMFLGSIEFYGVVHFHQEHTEHFQLLLHSMHATERTLQRCGKLFSTNFPHFGKKKNIKNGLLSNGPTKQWIGLMDRRRATLFYINALYFESYLLVTTDFCNEIKIKA